MIPQRVSLITLGAYDLPRLRLFYRQLGWQETPFSSDTYAAFTTAGTIVTLFPVEELAKDADVQIPLPEKPPEFRGVTLAVNADRPEDVDRAIEHVRQAGGRILREPSDAFWGGRTAYFSDPEHNLWEVAWNPTAVFDERGAMLSF
jgi:uncharacterized protein